LDYFVINKEAAGMVVDSTIHGEYHGSDHCPIQLKLKLTSADKDNTDEEVKEEAKVEAQNTSDTKKRSTSATVERRKSLKMSPKKRRSKSRI
jgi:hypothetical protein